MLKNYYLFASFSENYVQTLIELDKNSEKCKLPKIGIFEQRCSLVSELKIVVISTITSFILLILFQTKSKAMNNSKIAPWNFL